MSNLLNFMVCLLATCTMGLLCAFLFALNNVKQISDELNKKGE